MVGDEHFGRQSVPFILRNYTAEGIIILISPMSAIPTKMRNYLGIVSWSLVSRMLGLQFRQASASYAIDVPILVPRGKIRTSAYF